MSAGAGIGIELRSRISYPRQARPGAKYVISVDLDHAVPPDDWPYEREEYPVTCFLDAAPYFTQHAAGDATIVLHRFGGSYGPARFWLTAGKPAAAKIRLTLVNGAGVPVFVRTLEDITIVEATAPAAHVIEIADAEPVAALGAGREEQPGIRDGVFRWLHLSDLHFRKDPKAHWPRIAEDIAERAGGGSIDAIVVTGELTYTGRASEFDRASEFILDLQGKLAGAQGFQPPLLAVPGNHDAVRTVDAGLAFAPTVWARHPEAREKFWSDAQDPARVAVNAAFANYEKWRRRTKVTGAAADGLLPGDFAVSMRSGGLQVGLVGLNNAFLVQSGVADLDEAQLRAVCGDLEQFAAAHDLRLLVTHYHPSTLYADTRARFYEQLAPRWLFDVRLYGVTHQHQDLLESRPTSSGQSIGCSGVRCDGHEGQGYRIGEARLTNGRLLVRVSSRIEAEGRRFIPEPRQYEVRIDAGWRTPGTAAAPEEQMAPASVSTAPVAQRHALLIGLNVYADDTIPPLTYCVNDVRLLAPLLERFGYRTTQLLDKEATGQTIADGVLRLCQQSGPDDLLVVFYSGYNFHSDDGRVMLVAHDAGGFGSSSGVPLETIFELASRFRRRLLFLGDVFDRPANLALPEGMGVIGGITTRYPATEFWKRERGPFADACVRALEGASGPSLTVHGLADGIRQHLFDHQRQEPRAIAMFDSVLADLVVAEAEAEAPSAAGALPKDSSDGEVTGYDPAFLGGFEAPLPELTPSMRENASDVLHYEHFAVVMNRRRRLAFYAAVNVDLTRQKREVRSTTKWAYDERLGQEFQLGNEFYTRGPFDRARLVKRLQPAWGDTFRALIAAGQTNTFTNVVPLLSGVNQHRLWLGLPDDILRTQASTGRMVMFAGPVFADDDPVFRGVQIPRAYWRIMVFIKADGAPSAMAFLVVQNLDAGDEISRREPPKGIQQVPIAGIERLTGLSFGELKDVDVAASIGFGAAPFGAVMQPIRTLDDLITGPVSSPQVPAGDVTLSLLMKNGPLEMGLVAPTFTQSWQLSSDQRKEVARQSTLAASTEDPANRIGGWLFETLIPRDLWDDVTHAPALRFVVDEESAPTPWELLRDPRAEEPLAVRYPIVRMCSPSAATPVRRGAIPCRRALVIGQRLDLRQPFGHVLSVEVNRLAEQLTAAGIHVTYLESPTLDEMMRALSTNPYDLLHIATHVADFDRKWTMSRDPTRLKGLLKHLEAQQRGEVPEFVFVSVGHRAEGPREPGQNNLATSLVRGGARVAIVPSFVHSATGAAAFADHFYRAILDGQSVGEAMLAARRNTYHLRIGGDKTWAAYQCYGDPDLRWELPDGNTAA